MTKKKDDSSMDWSDAILRMGEERREIENKLSPSSGQLDLLLSAARQIYETVILMKNTSQMAHANGEIISFELAQSILDMQKKNLKESIQYLEQYASLK